MPVEVTPAGLLFLPVRVDGTGPWPFLVDTASPSAFGRRAIDSLEVEVGLSTGPGNRTLLRDVWFQVLGAEAWQKEVEVFGDDGCRIARSDCEGVAGQSFLSQFVVELDWEACVLRLHEPASWSYLGSGQALPLELEGGLPFVRAEVAPAGQAPVRGRFLIAIASPDAVRLASKARPEEDASKTRRLTAAGLRLGRFSLPALETTAASGFEIPAGAAGSIGAPALRRFRVILDYFRKRLILEMPGSSVLYPRSR
jgi:hypothetical protein